MAYDKLDAYVAAYNRGASLDELAGIIGAGGKQTAARARVTMLNSCLIRLGVVEKRTLRHEARLEALKRALATRKANYAEFKAWRAQRAANSIAAE